MAIITLQPVLQKKEIQKLLLTGTLKNIKATLKTITPQNPDLLKLIGWVVGRKNDLAAQKRYDIAKIFLDLGANVNLINRDGNSLLHSAYSTKKVILFNLLLNFGAKWDIPNKKGKTVYEICNTNNENESPRMYKLRQRFKKSLDAKIAEVANKILEQGLISQSPIQEYIEEPQIISPSQSPLEEVESIGTKRPIEANQEKNLSHTKKQKRQIFKVFELRLVS